MKYFESSARKNIGVKEAIEEIIELSIKAKYYNTNEESEVRQTVKLRSTTKGT